VLQPIGEHLREAGLMSAAQVEDILGIQRAEGGRFCSIALRRGVCTERELVRTLSRQLNVPGVCVADIAVERAARELLPTALKERLGAQPNRVDAQSVAVLMRDPLDEAAVNELRERTNLIVHPSVVLEAPLMALIRGRGVSESGGGYLAVASNPAVSRLSPATLPLHQPLPSPPSPSFSPAFTVEHPAPKIMTVGHDLDGDAALADCLEANGYAVIESAPNSPLLERLFRHRPAALLLDDQLPIARSLEICQRVKTHHELRLIRVILVTARFRGWRARADLMKTYGLDLVLEASTNWSLTAQHVSRFLMGSGGDDAAQRRMEAEGRQLFESGLLALRDQYPDAARQAFEESILIDSGNARPHYYLARIHDDAGRLFAALASYEEAIRLDPTYLRALKAMALLQEQSGFTFQAAGTWEQALSVCRDATTRRAIRGHLMRLLR